ncbi:hypothetical protein LSH36_1193g00004 [Paralvinella palmiformis]|uniref:Uncharacterized protein n=1 Tax=Paralvinella palmiformis TaxID=53620 RepID=A0AAD9MS32_9ANNE|nr:hypothetical protein LSH36_1193g00004 [Paralvinella palmiformis]
MLGIINSFPDERTVITKKNEHLVLTDSQPTICHKMINEAPLMFSLPVITKTISYWMNALMPTSGNFVAFLMLVLLHSSVTQVSRNILVLQVMQRQLEDIEEHDQDAMNEFGLPLQTDPDLLMFYWLTKQKESTRCLKNLPNEGERYRRKISVGRKVPTEL